MLNRISSILSQMFFVVILSNVLFLQESSIAITTKLNGDVKYKKYSDEKISNKLIIGSELFNDDLIQTGSDGYVKFSYLDDGTTIKIHKNSELYVSGSSEESIINKRLNISNGLIKLDVSKQKEDEFTVVTPTSVASVKGTSFILETSIDFGDKFYGFEGTVEIMNKESNQIIKLSRNLKVISTPDGQINSEIITQTDVDLINEMQSPVEQEIEIDDDGSIDDGTMEEEQIEEEVQESVNELRIIVRSLNGDEKVIVIKYTE